MSFLSRFSIQLKITLLVTLLVLVTGGAYTGLLVKTRKEAFIREVDARLIAAARSLEPQVGRSYHDRIEDADSVSGAEYEAVVARNNRLCRQARRLFRRNRRRRCRPKPNRPRARRQGAGGISWLSMTSPTS